MFSARNIFILLVYFGVVTGIFAQTDTINFPTILVAAKMPDKQTILTEKGFSHNSTPISVSCPSIKFRSSNVDSTIYNSITHHLFGNLKYPVMMLDMLVDGRLFIGFNIETNGAITHVTLLKGFWKEIDNQALEVISSIPAIVRTEKKTKNLYCILPIKYKLQWPTPNGPVTSLEQLRGDWTCVNRQLFTGMESYVSDAGASNFRVGYLNMSFFEYPCYLSGKTELKNDSANFGSLFLKDAHFRNDTLITKLPEESFATGYRYYVRDEFDFEIVYDLESDTVNPACLFGLWYLEKQRPDDIEFGPPFNITYPVYMPPVYKIDAKDIYDKRTLLMNVNGTLRKFRIEKFSRYERCIELISGDWCKEPFKVKYFTEDRKYNKYGQRIN